jgi:hypothetical protein
MSVVVQAIPDAEVFLSLEPEELGAKLLFIAKQHGDMFSLIGFEHEIWEAEMRGSRPIPETGRRQWRSPLPKRGHGWRRKV